MIDNNTVKVVFTFDDKSEFEKLWQLSDSQFLLDDNLGLNLLEEAGWDHASACRVYLGGSDITVRVFNFTLTDTVYFSSFSNMNLKIKTFQSQGTNIHMVNQSIEKMQLDCHKILLVDCMVKYLDIGLREYHERSLIKGKSNGNTKLPAYQMEKIDFRECQINAVAIYADYNSLTVRNSQIDNLNIRCGFFEEEHSSIGEMLLWQYSEIGNMELTNETSELKVNDSSVKNIVAKGNCLIKTLILEDSIIYDAHKFSKDRFTNINYDAWLLIEKSASNDKNTSLRAEANYQISKCLYDKETSISKVLGKVFDFCTGYGYKPIKALRSCLVVILCSTFLISVTDLLNAVRRYGFKIMPFDSATKVIKEIIENFIFSIAAFAGQSGASIDQGLIFWIATMEFVIGIVIFAMFVNALYVRYRD